MDYFLICIFARLSLSLIAYAVPKARNVLIAFLLIVATTWTLMSFGIIVRETGPEVKGRIWWQKMRPFHAIMYFLSATLLYYHDFKLASIVLAADVGVGTIVRYMHRYGS